MTDLVAKIVARDDAGRPTIVLIEGRAFVHGTLLDALNAELQTQRASQVSAVDAMLKAEKETCEVAAGRDRLFEALREMSEWWAYAIAKPPGAEPTADDHKKVEELAVMALNALHSVDPTYVQRLPGAAN